MNASGAVRQTFVSLAIAALLAGCAGGAGASPTQTPTPAIPTSPPTQSPTQAPTATVPATPAPALEVFKTSDLTYESADRAATPDGVDVYAPAKAGPWPVVVMFHGFGGSTPAADRADLSENARRVAQLGFVVFNASWGHKPEAPDVSWHDSLQALQPQAACAVEFARGHAAEYGGDPANMILFGHSGGANPAAMVAFARPTPTAGCLGGPTLGAINALVTWEGNWLLHATYPDWNAIIAEDPRVMDVNTPWKHLAEHKDLKVVMLLSEDPGPRYQVAAGDPWAADSWLALRDPSGDLRRQLEADGALADGIVSQADSDQLLYAVLKAQGNPVTLDIMPDSVHEHVMGAGWEVFLAAFPKAAAKD